MWVNKPKKPKFKNNLKNKPIKILIMKKILILDLIIYKIYSIKQKNDTYFIYCYTLNITYKIFLLLKNSFLFTLIL